MDADFFPDNSALRQSEKYIPFPKNLLFAAKAYYSSREFMSNCVEVFIESNPYSSSRQLISSSKAWAHSREIWSPVLHHTKWMCFAKNGNVLHICHCIPYTVWETKSLVWLPPMLLKCQYRHNMHSFLFRKNLICSVSKCTYKATTSTVSSFMWGCLIFKLLLMRICSNKSLLVKNLFSPYETGEGARDLFSYTMLTDFLLQQNTTLWDPENNI